VRELAPAFRSFSQPAFPLKLAFDIKAPAIVSLHISGGKPPRSKSVAGLRMECVERRMADAVAANKVDNKKHEKRPADQNSDGDF
jgi:hypothetical protein